MSSGPGHRRRSPGWVELSVALAALVVSAASLYIARQQTTVMHRQLAASIWPAVQYYTSNLAGQQPVISLTLENVGVGPARLERFSVTHEGRPVTDAEEFIAECCAPEGAPVHTITSFVQGRILPAGEVIDFLEVPFDPEHPEIYQRLNVVRAELDIHLCYCSVMEECWVLERGRRPASVANCDEEGPAGRADGQ